MYKVFLNEKLVLPGLDMETSTGFSVLRLPVHCGIRALREALDLLEAPDGPSVLRIGKAGEEAAAWQTLSAALEQEFAAGGFVTDPARYLLMIFRNGYWDLPKGKPHKGESIEATALREVEEETGVGKLYIRGSLGSSFHIFRRRENWILKESRWFCMDAALKTIPVAQIEEGITEARWVDYSEYLWLLPGLFPSLHHIAEKGWNFCGYPSESQ